MALTELTIAGGALYVGIKAYQKRRRKKQLAQFLQPEKPSTDSPNTTPPSLVNEAKTAIHQFTRDIIAPLFGDTPRRQHIDVSSSMDELEIQEAEQALNRKLVVFSVSLGLATTGALVYAPVSLLSLPGVLYVLKDVYADGYQALVKEGKINVDTLSAVLVSAYIVSGYYIICHIHAFLYLINRKLLTKVKRASRSSVVDVFRQQPRFVWVMVNGVEVEIPLEAIHPGDIVVVHTGESIPVDGTITEGIASIDQHILTGESQPLEKEVGDQVFAMTVVLSGRVCVRVEKVGEETTVAHIGHTLNHTAYVKTDAQLWAEVITDRTALPMLVLSGVAFPVFGATGAMVIMNAHFRYRLIIAASTCVLSYVNLAAQRGLLIKDGRILEWLNQVDTLVFDKTGTLTNEQPHVGQIHTWGDYDENEILRYAAAAEYKQTHPIAQAILQEARARDVHVPAIDEATYRIGYGLTVTADNRPVHVGSLRFMEMEEIYIPAALREVQAVCHHQGHSLVLVAIDYQVVGAIALHAAVRPEAKAIIQGLRQRNVKHMYIISGDHETPTQQLAAALGIDHYFAETLPENKADLIEQLRLQGRSVCYVGDGINDAIALKKAEVSVSFRGASTIATDTAQVILMDQSLHQLSHLFDLGREYEASMKSAFVAILTLATVSLGAVFVPYVGLPVSVLLSWASTFAGFSIALRPLIRHQIIPLKALRDTVSDIPTARHRERTEAASQPTSDLSNQVASQDLEREATREEHEVLEEVLDDVALGPSKVSVMDAGLLGTSGQAMVSES